MRLASIQGNINANNINHDSGVAIFEDNKITQILLEERYSRKKHDGRYPRRCLIGSKVDTYAINFYNEEYFIRALSKNNDSKFESLNSKQKYYHHICHVLESFYFSGFTSSAVLVVDGWGDCDESVSLWSIDSNYDIKLHKIYDKSHSLGVFYSRCNAWSGLNPNGIFGLEGKFMGLTSYGTPKQNHIFEFDIEKGLIINGSSEDLFGVYSYINNKSQESNIIHYNNFAATIQRDFNDAVMKLIHYIKELTGENNLCLSGGCFQNVIVNNMVCESGIFGNIYCSPFPSDGGCAVGNGVYHMVKNKKLTPRIEQVKHAYWGEEYPDEKILLCIDKEKYFIENITTQEIAKLLSENKILAWFQDRSEYGPRALGHRSLIGNPGNRENFNILNNKIKQRENWRPLAPSIPDELFDILFDVKSKDLTQFMLRSIPIKEKWRSRIPAVCHVDGTTRPQRLEREINPEYYDMIMEFYKITGLPCIINTSFNGPGEPIIENPKEALNFLDKTPDLYGIIFNGKYLVREK